MKVFLRGALVAGSAGWLALLWAGQEPAPRAEGESYEIEKPLAWLFQHPVSFSPRLAQLPKGTAVTIVEKQSRGGRLTWAKVTADIVQGSETVTKTGWLLLPPATGRAGDVAAHLGGAPAPTSLTLAIKGVLDILKEYNKAFAAHFPQEEASYEALRDAGLEPADVDSFTRAGGLKMPAGEEE